MTTAPLLPRFEVYHYRTAYPHLFGRPFHRQLRTGLVGIAFATFTFYAFWAMGFFDFAMIGRGMTKLGDVIAFMLPPRHNGWFAEFAVGIAETLAMAFIGTLIAALGALPLGFLGAKNVIPNWMFHFGLRRVFDGLRGIDTLIWALIFVNVVGLGPFAGILAIGFGDMPVLAKLFAEAIENIDAKPVEGVKAAGGGRLEIVRLGMFPQVFPVILSQTLYYFESNTRSATILGIVGAGGIGLQLSDRIRVNNWDEASFIILMILGTVYGIDILSRHLRRRFIGTETYRP